MRKIKYLTLCALLAASLPAIAQEEPEKTEKVQPEKEKRAKDVELKALRDRIEKLETSLQAISEQREEEELEKLRQSALSEAATAEEEKGLDEKTYIMASRSLQALNPEISVSGDFLAQLVIDDDSVFYRGANDRSGMPLRAMGLTFQSTLDPFSFTKMALDLSPDGELWLEELFITWTGVLPQLNITLGRFRQLLGVVNRWHEHDLDQTYYPLALDVLLGEGGLDQSGVSFQWLMPSLWADTNELVVQVTNGSNEALFAGDFFSVPSVLAHLKSYWDLNESTYLELGLSGLFGFGNRRGIEDEAAPGRLLNEPWRKTYMGGADLTLYWQPLRRARYHSVTWRSEGFYVAKENPLEAGNYEQGWGAYSYLQYQLAETWFVGLRGDLAQAVGDSDRMLWQVVPYVTVWQSEFVYLRLEVRHGEPDALGHDTRVLFQVNWAAGPHKHEKY
ncbi:MAG: hypothetical protein JRF33_00305 [Deltaproteobacteria bacterium]|nr:hypothetical protein [Deltaproteobacteria bacterium]